MGILFGLAHVRGIWVLQALELILMLSVPGLLCLRALRTAPEAVREFWPYIPCTSLAMLMVSGLAVDLLGPPLGVSRPLATAPIATSLSIVCAGLVLAAAFGLLEPRLLTRCVACASGGPGRCCSRCCRGSARCRAHERRRKRSGNGRNRDDRRRPPIRRVARAALERRTVGDTHLRRLAGTHVVLLLRGHYVYGFDIASEYQTFTRVLHAGRWYASHPNDPYGAMLSLTILPSSFVALTGASSLLVFKAVYPFVFALFPVAVFLLATRVISRRFAYLGTLFVVVQNYLFQQLPAIARQELALLLFVCLVAAMFDARLRRWSRGALIVVLGGGLALSHDRTTDAVIALFAFAIVAELARRLFFTLRSVWR